jgi:hypothetical protein
LSVRGADQVEQVIGEEPSINQTAQKAAQGRYLVIVPGSVGKFGAPVQVQAE